MNIYIVCLIIAIINLISITANATLTKATIATSNHFERIKQSPSKLEDFLVHMPKGGELHKHLSGSSMAENIIQYSKGKNLCIDKVKYVLTKDDQCKPENLLDNVIKDPDSYNTIIDKWSMRNFNPKITSGHKHFFSDLKIFDYPILYIKQGEILSEVTERAAQQNVIYLELLITIKTITKLIPVKNSARNLKIARNKLLSSNMEKLIAEISNRLNSLESKQQKLLACNSKNEKPGCHVKIRYLYQIYRKQPPDIVFLQLLTGFEAANKDHRIVGINLVQQENHLISMRDYQLHMQMIKFLHKLYPNVRISLHAGELTKEIAPRNALRFHIREAINTGHADRIGHGVSIIYDDNHDQLLKQMAKDKIAVEINLTSNDLILGIAGNEHPLPLYISYDVPVVLSTDVEGTLRTNLTQEYKRAVLTYKFSYETIKNIVRNSITYSFLPGKNLWKDSDYRTMIHACTNDSTKWKKPSSSCQHFLNSSEKATLQWKLEKQFEKFENHYCL